MTAAQLRVAVIIGSVRAGRVAPAVAGWLMTQLSQHGELSPDVIDLAGLELPGSLDGSGDAEVFAKRLDVADAFIIVTPEYNHGYPGALKTAIDTARDEWRAKPAGLVSYGGLAGGVRAAEQLRLVFAELHVPTVRQAVSLHRVHDLLDETGTLHEPAADAAARAMLAQLSWWAYALRGARAESPYDV